MAKVIIKSEKITPFGGIFHVREHFSRFVGPVNRQSSGTSVHIVLLSIQRDCGFFVKCLLLWRRLCGGCDEPFDASSLTSSLSSHMQLWHNSQGNLWAELRQHDLYFWHGKGLLAWLRCIQMIFWHYLLCRSLQWSAASRAEVGSHRQDCLAIVRTIFPRTRF